MDIYTWLILGINGPAVLPQGSLFSARSSNVFNRRIRVHLTNVTNASQVAWEVVSAGIVLYDTGKPVVEAFPSLKILANSSKSLWLLAPLVVFLYTVIGSSNRTLAESRPTEFRNSRCRRVYVPPVPVVVEEENATVREKGITILTRVVSPHQRHQLYRRLKGRARSYIQEQ